MNEQLFQVDAFTNQPFRGNPAGVVLLDEEQPDSWMQSVAQEMNLSETAFVIGEKSPYNLRWFTPAVEVELCGHATLATAHILFEREIAAKNEAIEFKTRSGILTTTYNDGWVQMDFPSFSADEILDRSEITRALNETPDQAYNSGESIMAVFDVPEKIYKMAPDFELIKRFNIQGIMVTSHSEEPGIDFISRYFAPNVGIDEDPVTGSAHCSLGPYWGARLDKSVLNAKQVSDRGGEIQVRVKDDRTFISGQAVTIFSGKLLI